MTIEPGKPLGKEGTILGKVFESQGVIDAKSIANKLIEQASFSEAVKVIDGLMEEVRGMKISDRFSSDLKPADSVWVSKATMSGGLTELNEKEFKRVQLIRDLESLRSSLLGTISNLETVVLDIEATKQD